MQTPADQVDQKSVMLEIQKRLLSINEELHKVKERIVCRLSEEFEGQATPLAPGTAQRPVVCTSV